ncbi:hypothetical protein E4U41_005489 [Claviceps citrina]|nr:hypothetical protein E4U41_005489 [Claviceps citrina]
MLDDSRARYERLARELKSAQAQLRVAGGAAGNHPSRRSSVDSTRSGSVSAGAGAGAGPGAGPGAEMMYLKTILLQFLEQKDGRLRAQLVPVLGKLLKFDKTDEQKWFRAVQHMDVK